MVVIIPRKIKFEDLHRLNYLELFGGFWASITFCQYHDYTFGRDLEPICHGMISVVLQKILGDDVLQSYQ